MNSSAPGKIILFGEHAVVHGKPALVGAISARLHTAIKPAKESVLKIPDINIEGKIEASSNQEAPLFRFYSKGLELFDTGPLEIKVTSEFPIGAGLGSSAAMACSFAMAASKKIGKPLTKEEIKNHAHEMEKVIHGNPSGVDTTVISFGGFLRYQTGEFQTLETPSLPLVVGYTGRSGDTKETVAHVKKLLEEEPEETGALLDGIGNIVDEAQEILHTSNYGAIGNLMNRNHEILQTLGVSSPELDSLVKAARDAGAYGAKLTGGGGGGCMIALGGDETAEAIKNAGGLSIIVNLSPRGVE